MPWPLSQDYNEAIQTPAQCFADPELRQGEAVTNTLGLPAPCSGNFADVYAVVSGQQKWAVKCFTRQIHNLRERYAEISKYLSQVQLPFMVEFKYLDQGIRVRGQWHPILKMQWVEGLAFNAFVRANLENSAVLQSVSQIWVKLAARLREANLAHGDLQHGNILLVPGARAGTAGIKLVDYDGMCVPALELLKATEVGHPSYQHPQRLREATYGLHIDNFSHLVIYTALRALAVGGRKLWDRYDDGDNLLFSPKDFQSPRQSPVFQEMVKLDDAETRNLVQALANAAQKPIDQVPWLADLVAAPNPKTAAVTGTPTPPQPQRAIAESPFAAAATTVDPRPRTDYNARRIRGMGVGVGVAVTFAVLALAGVGAVLLMTSARQQPTVLQAVQEAPRAERSPPATPLIVSSPPAQVPREALFRYDFEDGKLPSICSTGKVVEGPQRPGNRFCLQAGPTAGEVGRVVLKQDPALFTYMEDMALVFDVRLATGASSVDIYFWNQTQQVSQGTKELRVASERWVEGIVLPIAGFKSGPNGTGPKPGDKITNVIIQTRQVGGTLYLDNLELIRVPNSQKSRENGRRLR